jgi:UDP-3-O-[3-hydroxymyristoyl] glucosamine N-acyltransferase
LVIAMRHSSAIIESLAIVSNTVKVGANVVICALAKVGEDCIIEANAYIGPSVELGKGCHVHVGVSIEHCSAGEGVVFKPGSRIGQDGFGFLPALTTDSTVQKKPQTRRVILENMVEIGANSTVDRGSWRDTRIGAHTKLDNQVHIAHNVWIGKNCLLAAQVGIAGSCELGNRVLVGGQTGIAQYVKVEDDCQIAAKSGVTTNVFPKGIKVGGFPAIPIRQFHRNFLNQNNKEGTRDPRRS